MSSIKLSPETYALIAETGFKLLLGEINRRAAAKDGGMTEAEMVAEVAKILKERKSTDEIIAEERRRLAELEDDGA